MRCIGTWPGPSIMTWQSCFHAIFGQLTQSIEFCELSLIVGIGDRPRSQSVAKLKADVIGGHDLAYSSEACVEKILLHDGQGTISP